MTIGTGFFGRSSVGENLAPKHLVNWTRVAYNSGDDVRFGDFADLPVWERPPGPVPAYPVASNLNGPGGNGPGANGAAASGPAAVLPPWPAGEAGEAGEADAGDAGTGISAQAREQLRALIIEELEHLIRG